MVRPEEVVMITAKKGSSTTSSAKQGRGVMSSAEQGCGAILSVNFCLYTLNSAASILRSSILSQIQGIGYKCRQSLLNKQLKEKSGNKPKIKTKDEGKARQTQHEHKS